MILTKTPMRLSFIGGGSDLPVYYRAHGGAVVSSSIDKYVYICVNKRFDDSVRVSYSRTEEVAAATDVAHPLVRAALAKTGIAGGVEITSIADIPSRGSGLGSSSAFTVGVLHALHAYRGEYRSKAQLADEACDVEINMCGEPIGKQDQYGAAIGGLNFIRFNPDDSVDVEPIVTPGSTLVALERSLLMFYTGLTRSASDILEKQGAAMVGESDKTKAVARMVKLADVLRDRLAAGDETAVGDILHEGWMLKRGLAEGISSSGLDDIYARARAAGAVGGKLLGAGGGGFFVFYVPEARHEDVKRALSPLRHIDMTLERRGTSIVFYE